MASAPSRRAATALARAAMANGLPRHRPWRARDPLEWTPAAAASFFSVPNLDDMCAKTFSSTKTVRHSPERLFQVVADVDKYEDFVPFCARSRVLRRVSPANFEAELEIGFRLFNERYVSDVTLVDEGPGGRKSVTAEAIAGEGGVKAGLFERLVSAWRFEPGSRPGECVVRFDVDFKVNSIIHAQAVGLFFEEVSRMQIDAFVERCEKLFGKESHRVAPEATRATTSATPPTKSRRRPNAPGAADADDARPSADDPLASRVAAAFDHAAANPTRRDGEDDDLDNPHPGLGLRDFANACRELEGVDPFGAPTAARPLLCGALHVALDAGETGRVPWSRAASAARLVERLANDGDDGWTDGVRPSDVAGIRKLLIDQLKHLKRRMPNVARLASAQQQRVLEGEIGDDDEGRDFDILLETAMADVVVEHNINDVDRLARELASALGATEGVSVGGSAWAAAARKKPDLLSHRKLEGILRFGVLTRLARAGEPDGA